MSCPKRTQGDLEPSMGQHRCGYRRGKPSIVRLDSTGENTTGNLNHPQRTSLFGCNRNCEARPTNTTDGDQCLKKLVGNLNVCSLLDSANMCFESAANYLASKQTVSNHLKKDCSANISSSLGFIRNIFSSDKTGMTTAVIDKTIDALTVGQTLDKNMNAMPTCTNPTWSCSNLLSAFQSGNILGNCNTRNTPKMSVPKAELYVPPQRRRMANQRPPAVTVDPKLTPYNAKLLEKSKKFHSDGSDKPHASGIVTNENEKLASNIITCLEKTTVAAGESPDSKEKQENEAREEVSEIAETESVSKMDWFEYECPDIAVIPITITEEKLESCMKNNITASQETPKPQQPPVSPKQLHSWFSIDIDKDVRKCRTRGSSSSHLGSAHCKPNDTQINNESSKLCDKKTHVKRIDGVIQVEADCMRENEVRKDCMKPKHSWEHSKPVGDISAILYERSCGKSQKRRPSKKKRNRHKAQMEQKCPNSLKLGSAVHPRSPVAFILGVDSNSSNNVHSFQFTCDIDSADFDSDSDFSTDSDENFSSLDDDDILGLRCNDPLRGFGFTVSCSIQPTSTTMSPATNSSKEIDEINNRWQVHISVRPETKKPSTKKVHYSPKFAMGKFQINFPAKICPWRLGSWLTGTFPHK